MIRSSDRFAHTGAATAPAFSCDGGTVFHLRGAGLPQLWAMEVDGANARAVAVPGEKVAFLRRAPKDDRVLFGMDAGGDERQQLWLAEADAAGPVTQAPA